MAAGLVVLIVLQGLTVIWAFLVLYDFHIARSGEDDPTGARFKWAKKYPST